MIGLTYLLIFGVLGYFYFRICLAGLRWLWRKSHSHLLIIAGVVTALLIPTAENIVNLWYHKNVLCTRQDVGVKIYRKVHLSDGYYDQNKRFIPPDFWGSRKEILIDNKFRFIEGEEYHDESIFTAYKKVFLGVFDDQEKKYISYYTEYWSSGHIWWLEPFQFIFRRMTYNGSEFNFKRSSCREVKNGMYSATEAYLSVFEN